MNIVMTKKQLGYQECESILGLWFAAFVMPGNCFLSIGEVV